MNLKHSKILAVITDAASWPDFQILAKVIEEEAHACDHYVVFYNLNGEDHRLRIMLEQIQADAYLISRRIFLRTEGKEIMAIQKPFGLMEEPISCVVTRDGKRLPERVLKTIIRSVKYVCL